MSDLKQSSQQREEGAGLKRLELLAPAGSYDAMRAAINAGADAVYMGGSRFGARAYAENPDEEGIIKAIEFCHLRGKKVYLTVNTLFKEEELYDCLFEFLTPYYEAGLDAVIVQDIGVMRFVTENFPGLAIHVSTQATVTTGEGINSLLNRGYRITRVVPARELSLKELQKMRETTELELEVFAHGALCYCYSGQCLLSSMAGGRSGNRGRCAQPCRRMYKATINSGDTDRSLYGDIQRNGKTGAQYGDCGEDLIDKGYLLSPKDMCTLPYLHEMIEAGINSLKLEGRMKSPEYCAGVVSVYREFIDKYYELGPQKYREKYIENSEYLNSKIDELRELYNRGGFNNSYLFTHNGRDMMSMERPNHSGVEVGLVIGVSGRKAEILFNREADKGDVLEIRGANGKAVYEYTVADRYPRGSKTAVITMKDRLAERGLLVYRTRCNRLLDSLREEYLEKDSKVKIAIEFTAKKGEPARLVMINESDGISAEIIGNIVEKAQNAPMTEDKISKQITKLGDTDFVAASININCDEDIFMPVGELNRLRREAAEQLKVNKLGKEQRATALSMNETELFELGMDSTEHSIDSSEQGTDKIEQYKEPVLVASVMSLSQLSQVLSCRELSEVYFNSFDLNIKNAEKAVELVKQEKAEGRAVKLYFGLPFICRRNVFDKLKDFCEHFSEYGFIARNHESIALLNSIGAKYRTDYNMYALNSLAACEVGSAYTLPLEATIREIKNTGLESLNEADFVVYGLSPVMLSAQCVYKNVTGKCMKENGRETGAATEGSAPCITLTDEKGFSFRNIQQCATCTNIIYNSAVTNIMDKPEEINSVGAGRLRADFTFESDSEIKLVLDNLVRVPAMGGYNMPSEIMGMKYTNGHYFNGVM